MYIWNLQYKYISNKYTSSIHNYQKKTLLIFSILGGRILYFEHIYLDMICGNWTRTMELLQLTVWRRPRRTELIVAGEGTYLSCVISPDSRNGALSKFKYCVLFLSRNVSYFQNDFPETNYSRVKIRLTETYGDCLHICMFCI